MTEIQAKLLEMIEEIDNICSNNEIPYYLSGGSVIGALRHRGFIPWDDDIDILIDSKYWPRLYESLMREMPENRILGCLENSVDFPNVVYRYCDITTADIHKNELFGESVAGIVIDIILLDSITADETDRREYLINLALYSDISNPYYTYGHRFTFPIPYDDWHLRVEQFGKKQILSELGEKLTTFENLDVDYYIVRWPPGPTFFHKSVFGNARYVPFEHLMLPIPEKANDFLRDLYGDEWIEVPQGADQVSHDTVLDMNHGYQEYFDHYLNRLNLDEIHQFYAENKDSILGSAPVQQSDGKGLALIAIAKEHISLQKRLKREGVNLDELFLQGDFDSLVEYLHRYTAKQTNSFALGSEFWDGIVRRHDPAYLDCGDDFLALQLWTLLYQGSLSKAFKTARARLMTVDGPLSDSAEKAASFINRMRDAISLFYKQSHSDAYNIVEELIAEEPGVIVNLWKMRIRLARILGVSNAEQELQWIDGCLLIKPADGELIKLGLDNVCQSQSVPETMTRYLDCIRMTRNGLVWLEVKDMLDDHAQECVEKLLGISKLIDCQTALGYVMTWIGIGSRQPAVHLLRIRLQFEKSLETKRRVEKAEDENERAVLEKQSIREYKRAERLAIAAIRKPSVIDEVDARELLFEYWRKANRPEEFFEDDLASRVLQNREDLEALLSKLEAKGHESSSYKSIIMARLYSRLGRVTDRIAMLRKAVELNPNNVEACTQLRVDMIEMIREIEKAATGQYRRILIKEWYKKYPDLEESASILVQSEAINDWKEEDIRKYLSQLLTYKRGRDNTQETFDELLSVPKSDSTSHVLGAESSDSHVKGSCEEPVSSDAKEDDRIVLNAHLFESEVGDDATKQKSGRILTDEQKVSLQLLSEVDQICKEHGIQYYLHGDAAGMALRSGGFDSDAVLWGVEMTAQNALRFIDAVEHKCPKNRALEYIVNSDSLASINLRYVSTDTLYYAVNWEKNSSYHGIYLSILVVRRKPYLKLTRTMLLALERGEEGTHQLYTRPMSWKEKATRRITLSLHRIVGEQRYRKWLFSLIVEKGVYPGHGPAQARIQFDWLKSLPESWFTEPTALVRFEGELYPVYKRCVPSIRKWYGANWKKRRLGLSESRYLLIDANITYSEFVNALPQYGIDLAEVDGNRREFTRLLHGRWGSVTKKRKYFNTAKNVRSTFATIAYLKDSEERIKTLWEDGSILEIEPYLNRYNKQIKINARYDNREPLCSEDILNIFEKIQEVKKGKRLSLRGSR